MSEYEPGYEAGEAHECDSCGADCGCGESPCVLCDQCYHESYDCDECNEINADCGRHN